MASTVNLTERLPNANLKVASVRAIRSDSIALGYLLPAADHDARRPTVLGVHPKEPKIIYCSGKLVVIRDLENPANCLIYQGHNSPTTAAKISPNGYWVASADTSGKVRVWSYDNPEHTLKVEVPVFAGEVKDLSWDPESKRIVAVGDGRTLLARVFMWDTGNSIGEIAGHQKRILSVDYKPTRPFRILTASEDFNVCAFEGPPFKFKHSMQSHTNFANCVRYSPDGNYAVSVGSDKGMVLYDAKTSEKLSTFPPAHAVSIYSVAWSPDSKQLLTASGDKTVKLWDVETLSVVTTFTFGNTIQDMQQAVVWHGDYMVSLSLSGNLNYLNLASPDTPSRYDALLASTRDRPRREQVFTGSYDGVVCAWTGATAHRFGGDVHTAKITCIDAMGGLLASGGWDDKVRFGAVADEAYASSVELNGAQPTGLALATHGPSDSFMCAVSSNKGVKLIVNGTLVHETANFAWTGTCIAVHPSGTQLAVGGQEDNTIHLFDVVYGADGSFHLAETAPLVGHLGALTSIAYSPDGSLLAAGDAYRDVRVWDLASREAKVAGQWVFHSTRVTTVAWSPSGQHVVSGALDGHLFVWSVAKPSARHQFDYAHEDGVMGAKFMADDQIISIGNDAAVRTWLLPAF
ncbi:hypothetical protein SPRG_10370 [Saprolegnia parasitica CBS 223.65]|uniref:Uncharacterized protein n=1 Tax=Saprolegnia parasitica (strain CBS 223.65) TaxID=695850 RepID=A0A067C5W9_SAPPC|nr:hypothetical protein SPRG_10370 [Saprolegnia parasitica CBS 223.65]KDO24555.1 hypothetical protein SPRG_10370 [Saprolegnia parasitica CBS 223.65]|eukprot:XP_012204816.1 hypothetical protein SPRG_10370 [Saprolegnia parasitica CBS 223.65]